MRKQLRHISLLMLLLLSACSDYDTWTEEQRVNAQNVHRAMELRNDAVNISNRSGPGVIDREEFRQIRLKLREALEHAVAVHDDVLDKLHPELKAIGKTNL